MMGKYMDVHNSSSTERKAHIADWLGWKTDVGGSVHNVHHIYHWNDYDQRDRLRATVFDHPMWFGNEDGPMQRRARTKTTCCRCRRCGTSSHRRRAW